MAFTLICRWLTCQCRDYQPFSLVTLMTLMRFASDINLVLDWINWVEMFTSSSPLGAQSWPATTLVYLLMSSCIIASVNWIILTFYGIYTSIKNKDKPLEPLRKKDVFVVVMIFLNIFLQDLLQIILVALIEGYQNNPQISPYSTAIFVSHFYSLIIRIAFLYEQLSYSTSASDVPKCIQTFPTKSAITSVAQINETVSVSSDRDGYITTWDIYKMLKIRSFQGHKQGMKVYSVASDNDAQSFYSSSSDNTVKYWNIDNCEESNEYRTYRGHKGDVTDVIRLNSKQIVTCSTDDKIKLWNIETGKCIRTFAGKNGHEDDVTCLAVASPRRLNAPSDEYYFLSGSNDKSVKMWSVRDNKKPIQTFANSSMKKIKALAMFHDSKTFVTGSTDGLVRLWKIGGSCNIPSKVFSGHKESVTALAIMTKYRFLSGSVDTTIKLWDKRAASCLWTYKGHAGTIRGLARIDEDSFISGCSGDKEANKSPSVKVWHVGKNHHKLAKLAQMAALASSSKKKKEMEAQDVSRVDSLDLPSPTASGSGEDAAVSTSRNLPHLPDIPTTDDDEETALANNTSGEFLPTVLENSTSFEDAVVVNDNEDINDSFDDMLDNANATVTSGTSYTYTTEEMFQDNVNQVKKLQPSDDIRETQRTTISESEMAEIESEILQDEFTSDIVEEVKFDHWGPLFEGTYTGQIHRDTRVPHGQGTLTLNSGTTYAGQWKDANRHGYGIYEWFDGKRYEGGFENDKFSGYGSYNFASGDKYEGLYKDGKQHGWGVYTWAHGDSFEGVFENDTKTDTGIYTWANGEVKAGNIVKCVDGKFRILQ